MMHFPSSMVSLTEAPIIGAFGAGAALLFAVGLGAFFRALRRVEQQNLTLDRVQMALGEMSLANDAAVRLAQKRLFLLVVDGEEAVAPPAPGEDYAARLAEVLSQRELAQAGKPLGIVELRLLVICAATQCRHVVPLMPALEDLEQLTREYELSHGALPVLRGVTNVLLMCGICGTLWGVSEQLGREGSFAVESLVHCLYPSLVAVVGFIVLHGVLGGLLGRFERMVKQLDELTLRIFVPLFQPPPMVMQHMELFRKAILPLSSPRSVEQLRYVKENWLDVFLKHSKLLQYFKSECFKVGTALAKRLQAAVMRRAALVQRGREQAEQRRMLVQLIRRRVYWADMLRQVLEECRLWAFFFPHLIRQSAVPANKEVGATLRDSVRIAKQLTKASKPSGPFYKRMRAMLRPYRNIKLRWSRLWSRLSGTGEEAAVVSGTLSRSAAKLIPYAQDMHVTLLMVNQILAERPKKLNPADRDPVSKIGALNLLLDVHYQLRQKVENMCDAWGTALQSIRLQLLGKRVGKKSARVALWLALTAAAGLAVGVYRSVAMPPLPEEPSFAEESATPAPATDQ